MIVLNYALLLVTEGPAAFALQLQLNGGWIARNNSLSIITHILLSVMVTFEFLNLHLYSWWFVVRGWRSNKKLYNL